MTQVLKPKSPLEQQVCNWIALNPKKTIAGGVGLFLLLILFGGSGGKEAPCNQAREEWQKAEKFSERLKDNASVDIRTTYIAVQDTEKAKSKAIEACETSDK